MFLKEDLGEGFVAVFAGVDFHLLLFVLVVLFTIFVRCFLLYCFNLGSEVFRG